MPGCPPPPSPNNRPTPPPAPAGSSTPSGWAPTPSSLSPPGRPAPQGQPGADRAEDRFPGGRGGGPRPGRWGRARLYEVVELVKITARRVRLFDDGWASRTQQLIHRAHALMNDLARTA